MVASRSILFLQQELVTVNVDGRPISSNADYQEDALCVSDGDEFQVLIDNSDLLTSNQDRLLNRRVEVEA